MIYSKMATSYYLMLSKHWLLTPVNDGSTRSRQASFVVLSRHCLVNTNEQLGCNYYNQHARGIDLYVDMLDPSICRNIGKW